MESRLYWLQGGYVSARSQGVRKGQSWPWSALVDADMPGLALVGPWQYQCSGVGWVVPLPCTHPGIPSRYPTPAPTPGTHR